MKNIVLLFFSLFFLHAFGQNNGWKSQINGSGVFNYFELSDSLRNYFLNLPDSLINFEYKNFQRQDYFWRNRAGTNFQSQTGDINGLYKAMNNYLQNPICNNQPNSTYEAYKWELFGPHNNLPHPSIQFSDQNQGIVSAIYVDPLNSNKVLIGTGASGLWLTTNGGQSWTCVSDDLRIGGLGISSIAEMGGVYYATTGVPYGDRGYGAGLIFANSMSGPWNVNSNFPIPGGKIPMGTKVVCNPSSNKIYVLFETKLFSSSDNGQTWTDILTPTPLNISNYDSDASTNWIDFEYSELDPNVLTITSSSLSTNAQVLISYNGGNTWNNISNQVALSETMLPNVISTFSSPTTGTVFTNSNWSPDGNYGPNDWFRFYQASPLIQKAAIFPAPNLSLNYLKRTNSLNQYSGYGYPNTDYILTADLELPADCNLKIIFKNTFTNQEFVIYENNFVANPSTSISIPFTTDNNYYNSLELVASANTSYNQSNPITVDNIQLEIIRHGRFEASYYNNQFYYFALKSKNLEISKLDLGSQTAQSIYEFTISTISASYFKMAFEHSKTNPNKVYFGGISLGVYDELSNQLTIIPETKVHDDIRDIQIFTNGSFEEVFVGTDGGISKSSDFGQTWIDYTDVGSLPISQFYGMGIANEFPYRMIGGTQDHPSHVYDGQIWTLEGSKADGGRSIVSPSEPNWFYDDLTGNVSSLSTYGSATYGLPLGNLGSANRTYLGSPHAIDPFDKNIHFIGSFDGLLKSTNNATSFSQLTLPGSDGIVTAIGIHPANSNLILVAKGQPSWDGSVFPNNRVFKSIDGGNTWIDITSNLSAPYQNFMVTAFTFDPADEQRLWVGFNGIYMDIQNPSNVLQRAFYSGNQGQSWVDVSSGLPYFPVNDLKYQPNSNDIIYAATDVGVFVWNKTIQQWECFSNNLPACIVTDIEFNTCTQEVFAATFGRAIWKTSMIKDAPELITGNVIWATPVTLDYDLLISANSTLTISSTLEMAKGRKIMIEPGGDLILDGGTIMGRCGQMWQGIEAWGNRNLNQTGNNQAQITLKNNALIRDAIDAITTCKKDANGNIDFNTTGARIYAENSTFKNNKRDVEFLSYTNQTPGNVSRFNNVTFITDGPLNDKSIYPNVHVSMWDVHGVKLSKCTFTNTTSLTSFPIHQRGKGIFTVDATYNVVAGCNPPQQPGVICPQTNLVPNQFINLHTGIESMSSNPLNTVEIDGNTFTGNQFGVLLQGMDYAIVTRNTFDVPGLLSLNYPYGLYLKQCRNYEVEENTFTHTGAADINVGVAILNSGLQPVEVYNNTFDKLYVGILPMGLNRNILPATPGFGNGLQMRCNEYTGNEWDQAVTLNGSIALEQGSIINTQTLAGNRFSHNCVGFDNDFWGIAMPGTLYWSHSNIPPICYTSASILLQNTGIPFLLGNPELSCPSSLSTSTPPDQHKNLIRINKNLVLSESEKIDANNTVGLLSSIGSQSPGQAKNALLAASPYLSDEVLMAAINKNFPPGIIKEIILANSPLSSEVLALLNTKNYPSGIKNQMLAAQSGISERTKLESSISFYQAEQEKAKGDYIRYYLLKDTSGFGIDSVIQLFKDEGSDPDKCMEIAALIKGKMYTEAEQKLNDHLAEPEDYFCKLLNIILTLEQTLGKCYAASTPDKSSLEDLSLKDPKFGVCTKAQSLLETIFGTDFPEPIELPELNQGHAPDFYTEEKPSLSNYLKLYPNPTTGMFTIEYSMPDNVNESVVEVYDITGRTITHFLLDGSSGRVTRSLNEIPSGVYFYSVLITDRKVEIGKLILVK